jgi:hypothetical protein
MYKRILKSGKFSGGKYISRTGKWYQYFYSKNARMVIFGLSNTNIASSI